MAANTLYAPWRRAETNALELLYNAGWTWAAISVHVSGIYGHRRTREACRCKGAGIGISAGQPRVRYKRDITDDIEDMMILGYSSRQMARELGVERSTVMHRIRKEISPQRRASWMKDVKRRHAEAARAQLAKYRASQRRRKVA